VGTYFALLGSVGNLGFLLAMLFLSGDALAFKETVIPLPGWKVGVLEGQRIRCIDISLDPAVKDGEKWIPCDRKYFLSGLGSPLRVLGNERAVAVVYSDRVDFFDENGRPKPTHRIDVTGTIDPESLVNGVWSTESEITQIADGRLIVRNTIDPQSQGNIALSCGEAMGHKKYAYSQGAVAIVAERRVIFRDLRRVGELDQGLKCVQGAVPDLQIPEGVDEVFLYRREYIGLLRGRVIDFFFYSKSRGWSSAHSANLGVLSLPPLDLSTN